MALTQEQYNKQPGYIKAEIDALRGHVSRLEEEVNWLRKENRIQVEASNTVVVSGRMRGGNNDTPVAPYSEIEFYLKDREPGRRPQPITVRIRRTDRVLEISGDEPLIIKPGSTNTIYVTQVER